MIYQNGVQRPMVMGIQEVIGYGKIDGFMRKDVEEKWQEYCLEKFILDEDEANLMFVDENINKKALLALYPYMSISYRILELITYLNIGEFKQGWAFAKYESDGSGWNFGVMKLNKFGTLGALRYHYKPKDKKLEEWIGSPGGAVAQHRYFIERILSRAYNFASRFGEEGSSSTIALLCDSLLNGGSFYSKKDITYWDNWELVPELKEHCQQIYEQSDDKVEAFIGLLRETIHFPELFAELRPRVANYERAIGQLERRRLIVNGSGVIKGVEVNLKELGL